MIQSGWDFQIYVWGSLSGTICGLSFLVPCADVHQPVHFLIQSHWQILLNGNLTQENCNISTIFCELKDLPEKMKCLRKIRSDLLHESMGFVCV